MSVSNREHKGARRLSRLSMVLIVAASVVVAAVVVWRADRPEPGTSRTQSEISAGESTALQTVPSAEATLAEIAEITDDFSRNAAMYRLASGTNKRQTACGKCRATAR